MRFSSASASAAVSSSTERRLAALALVRVEQGAFSSRLLASADGPGVRVRVLGVLRWLAALDWVLDHHVKKGLSRLDPEIRAVLRVGLHDAVLLGVPAAVSTDGAIHLARALGKGSAGGLVNAVLRRAIASWSRLLEKAPAHVRLSHPSWLVRRWRRELGREAAQRVMLVDQEPAPMWVWFREQGEREQLGEAGVELQPHCWCPGAWQARRGAAALVGAVQRGAAYAQDPSSQLVAHLAARLFRQAEEQRPERARLTRCVDLCSAPGGKSALLRKLCPGLDLVCLDRNLTRLRLVDELLSEAQASCAAPGSGRAAPTLSPSCPVILADSSAPPVAARSCALVLLDAPCSGSGTLRRHPELRWRLSLEEIIRLSEIQRRLLSAAAGLVAPGGLLLYSTCSIEPEENESLIDSVEPDLEILSLSSHAPAGACSIETSAGGLRLLPTADNDGFTIHAAARVD